MDQLKYQDINKENAYFRPRIQVLLNGKESLEELFAEMDERRYTEALKSKVDADQILPGFRGIINEQALPDKVSRMIIKGRIAA